MLTHNGKNARLPRNLRDEQIHAMVKQSDAMKFHFGFSSLFVRLVRFEVQKNRSGLSRPIKVNQA